MASRSPYARKPMLEEHRERELIQRWRDHGDDAALEELVTAHEPLVLKMANRYRATSLSINDLAQEGFIGLIEAARRFDFAYGVRFATYARWWIKSGLQDYALRNGSAVRSVTSSRQKSLMFALRKLLVQASNGSMPSEELKVVLAKRYSVSTAAVERMAMRVGARDRSLDSPVDPSGGLLLKDLLRDCRPDPEAVAIQSDEADWRHERLIWAIGRLPAREQRIIRERHLKEDRPYLRELSDEFGVSKERVRQLEKRALDKLRAILAGGEDGVIESSAPRSTRRARGCDPDRRAPD